MLHILQFAGDAKEHTMAEAREHVAKEFGLTQEDREELLPSGRVPRFTNRVAWCRVHLQKAGLLESRHRGSFNITPLGLDVLKKQPKRIDLKYLDQFPGHLEFYKRAKKNDGEINEGQPRPPDEVLEESYQELRSELVTALLSALEAASPSFFERVVVELLVRMGYGGSLRDAGQAIGKSGDEGIDGIIKEDRLGLDNVYIQAKKWTAVVGRPEIQKFVGALHGKHAKKGVFITTSSFSSEALEYTRLIDSRVVLIDGVTLAGYMIDFGVGTKLKQVYELKEIDNDYFDEE